MAELNVLRGSTRIVVSFDPGARLSEVLRAQGIHIQQPCGGRGSCHKCAVTLRGQVSPPNAYEQQTGIRLACQAVLLGDAEVILPEEQEMEQIQMGSGIRLSPRAPMPGKYGAAIDIGTTTLVLSLYHLESGTCLAETGMLNPQTSAAADVMGRISAALSGEQEQLRQQVTQAIDTLIRQACLQAQVPADEVESLVITGNTTMLYLLTGRNPLSLSRAPFEADCLFDETIELCGKHAYLPPCTHAFTGADLTCAVLASQMCEGNEIALLSDVGTNGELALWDHGSLLVTSTAAGPAFEGAGISCGCGSISGAIDRVQIVNGQLIAHTLGGAAATGVCGSGLIDAVAAGLALGEIDETGAMEHSLVLAPGICLTQGDIRAVQLAKAAVAAGIETLTETSGIPAEAIGAFYIAGGFGSHLNVQSAAAIGLFPGKLAQKARVIGNAALFGAAQMLLDLGMQERGRQIASKARHVNLGGNPAFNEHYMDRMMF